MLNEQPREALIRAAISLLGSARPPAMPLRDVAQAAGVTTGAIQHHFGNRHGLLVAAVDRQTERLVERLEAVERALPAGDPRRLPALLLELLPLDDERTREMRLLTAFEHSAASDPTLTTEFQRRYHRLLDMVAHELPGGATDAALLLSVTYGTGADLLLGVATPETAIAGIDRMLSLLGVVHLDPS
jgi:AcrR family transcriptional regulator